MKLKEKKELLACLESVRIMEALLTKTVANICFSKLEGQSDLGKIPYNQTKFVVYVCGKLKSIHERTFQLLKKKSPLIWNWISWISYDLCLLQILSSFPISHKKGLRENTNCHARNIPTVLYASFQLTCYFQSSNYNDLCSKETAFTVNNSLKSISDAEPTGNFFGLWVL